MERLEHIHGLQKLGHKELMDTSGGHPLVLPWFLAAVGTAAINEIIGDWDNFKAGLMGLPEIRN